MGYNRIQCRAVVLAMFNIQIVPPRTWLHKKKDLTKIGCGDCKWIEMSQAPI